MSLKISEVLLTDSCVKFGIVSILISLGSLSRILLRQVLDSIKSKEADIYMP